MDVQQFFKKNLKYVALILLALFFIKSFQSCNRNMTIKKQDKELVYLSDSLSVMAETTEVALLLQLRDCEDSNQELEYEVKLANAESDAANKRADAVQSTAEKIRKNTTIKIENKSTEDTVSVENQ
jgi:hypothetical protein